MADFKLALPMIFKHEGRYSDHKSDPGGATNYGISLKFLMQTGDLNKDGWKDGDINQDGRINVEDVKYLSEQDAAELYRMYFWDANGYSFIKGQAIANKVMDLAVNMGSYPAHLVIQRAVRAVNNALKITEDGLLGKQSFDAINAADPIQLLPAIRSEAAGYYRSIKYDGSKNFIEGWLNRAYA